MECVAGLGGDHLSDDHQSDDHHTDDHQTLGVTPAGVWSWFWGHCVGLGGMEGHCSTGQQQHHVHASITTLGTARAVHE